MTKRQVFYSFHYSRDAWRASKVRNMGVVEGNRMVTDNEWEEVKRKGDKAIQHWIDDQLKYRSCTVVLVGAETAERNWVQYEIIKSWNEGMGVVGIYINGLLDRNQKTDNKGCNPFDYVEVGGIPLSQIAKCYTPRGYTSADIYASINANINVWVEEAIRIRDQYGKPTVNRSQIPTVTLPKPYISAAKPYPSIIEELAMAVAEEKKRKQQAAEELLRKAAEEASRKKQVSNEKIAALIEAVQEQQDKKKRESEKLIAALLDGLQKRQDK
jgi:hypothetical protein